MTTLSWFRTDSSRPMQAVQNIGGPSFQMMAPKVFEQAIKVYNWPFAATIALVLMAVTLALSVASSLALQKRYGVL